MENSVEKSLINKVEGIRAGTAKPWQSLRVLNWIGYGFLIFSLIDAIAILVPPNFSDPVWEFGVVGNLVERVAAPLIGFGLIFVGDHSSRPQQERLLLKALSSVALALGLVYFILMAFGISSTVQIDRQNTEKIKQQAGETRTQLQQVQEAFQDVKTADQMEAFLGRFDSQGRIPEIQSDQEFQTAKQQFAEFLDKGQKQLKNRVEVAQSSQRKRLLKNSVKWNLGALLSGVLFIGIWRSTGDLRRRQ